MEKVDEPMDRISELPEPIIHHILSYLDCPRDVARVTPLSKKWRSIWASFIFFQFDQNLFKTSGGDHTEKFVTFVDNSIATKLGPMHCIHKFKISISQVTLKLKLHMYNWISCAIKKDVKELEIHIEEKRKTHYFLPDVIFTTKTLTSLKLCGCKFKGGIVIDLCNLKELSLKKSCVNTDVIQSFVQGCPLVEDLRLIHCKGIDRLHISTLVKLTKVELHKCDGLVCVNIELPSLVSFLYWGKETWECKINLGGCENLKYLTLKHSNLTDELFQDMLSKFYYLKELSVIRCRKLENVTMYAPYLSALEFSGVKFPFFAIDVARLCEIKLNLKYYPFRLVHDVLNFLRKFEKDGAWKLVVSSNKNVTIYEEVRKIPGLSTDDVKVELVKSPLKLENFVDNLLQMSRPNTLSLSSSSSSEFLKLLKEKIMGREENPKCCIYYLNKCWIHDIKDVKMVVRGKTQNVQRTTFTFNWHK